MNVKMVNLAEHMEYLDIVSEWVWSEWSSTRPLAYIKYRTANAAQKERIPMTFVALLDNEPVGTVSLWMNDLKSRQDLYPWVACLYVAEDRRNKGIGKLLQAHASQTAKKLGFKDLYLITDHNGYYEKFGWTFKELAPKDNGVDKTRIYHKDLTIEPN